MTSDHVLPVTFSKVDVESMRPFNDRITAFKDYIIQCSQDFEKLTGLYKDSSGFDRSVDPFSTVIIENFNHDDTEAYVVFVDMGEDYKQKRYLPVEYVFHKEELTQHYHHAQKTIKSMTFREFGTVEKNR